MTVVETGRFVKDANRLIPESDRVRLVEFLLALYGKNEKQT